VPFFQEFFKMLIALDVHPSAEIELGELLTVVHVAAANVVKDIRENIRNLVGGRMTHYEALIRDAVNLALRELDEAALAKGYDGVIGVKIANPTVVEGGVEVVVYGNAFRVVTSHASHVMRDSCCVLRDE
jgi:uncharacterized protein YbjQ (UPF0145 family)